MSPVPVLRDSRNLPVLRGWGFFESGIMLVSTKGNSCPHMCCSRVKCSGSILKVDFCNVNRALLPMHFVSHRSGSPSAPCCSVGGQREPRPFSFVRRSVFVPSTATHACSTDHFAPVSGISISRISPRGSFDTQVCLSYACLWCGQQTVLLSGQSFLFQISCLFGLSWSGTRLQQALHD